MKKHIVVFLLVCITPMAVFAAERNTHARQYNYAQRNLNSEFDTIYYLLNKRDSLVVYNSNSIYFGDPSTDGTWKLKIDGDNFVIQKRENGAYVTKHTVTP